MPIPFIMPKMDMDQESVTIIEWLKKEGEHIEKGEPVVRVETDKITSDVEAPENGVLAGILYHENEEAPVTKTVAYILSEGETTADLPARGGIAATASASVPIPAELQTALTPPAKSAVSASPLAERVAANLKVNLEQVPASGVKVMRADVEAFANLPAEAAHRVASAATPAARRLASETGVLLENVIGTGPRGRVQTEDVLASAAQKAATPAVQRTASTEALASGALSAASTVPLVGKRKRIAERLTGSYQTAPHIYLTVEVDMSAAEASRKHMNALVEKQNGASISVTAYLLKLVAWTLKQHPFLNSSLQGDQIQLLDQINLGVATALEDGLIVPVIHSADQLNIRQINDELRRLTAQARANALTREEIDGGTFTVSNLGMYGIQSFTAIINPPQSAILAVGTITRKPVVINENDDLEVRPMMSMTLSVDHRVVDGSVAAAFLADLAQALQSPDLALF